MKQNPEVIIILAYNFQEEIVHQCKEAEYKGEFILPLPNTPHFL